MAADAPGPLKKPGVLGALTDLVSSSHSHARVMRCPSNTRPYIPYVVTNPSQNCTLTAHYTLHCTLHTTPCTAHYTSTPCNVHYISYRARYKLHTPTHYTLLSIHHTTIRKISKLINSARSAAAASVISPWGLKLSRWEGIVGQSTHPLVPEWVEIHISMNG